MNDDFQELRWCLDVQMLERGDAAIARLREREAREKRSEWREGIVNVLDHEGNYLGCLGSETWAWTLDGGIGELKARVARLEEALRLFVPSEIEGRYLLLTKDDVERVEAALAHEEEKP